MKRTLLSIIVFTGMLAAQPFGPGGPGMMSGPGGPGMRGFAANEDGPRRGAGRLDALAEVLGMEPDVLAEKVAELRTQRKAEREAARADFEEVRALREQLKAAIEAQDKEQISALILQMEQHRTEMQEKRRQQREALINTVKSWSPGAEAGLTRLQEAAELGPALDQARMLGVVAGGGRGGRGGNSFGQSHRGFKPRGPVPQN